MKKPRLNRIYTKNGDGGMTRLPKGVVISKGALQVESYGTCDELCTCIGLLRAHILPYKESHPKIYDEGTRSLDRILNNLFDMGRLLARAHNPEQIPEDYDVANDPHINFLEENMDRYLSSLKPLKSFTLPGSGLLNAHSHHCRTVCRRWERLIVRLMEEMPVPQRVLIYANRLSDYLYVFSRWVSLELGEDELLWEPSV